MVLCLTVDSIDSTDRLPCLNIIASPDANACKLAIEREIIAVLNQDTLIVPRNDHNLTYNAIEYSLDTSSSRHLDSDTIIERKLNPGENRMVSLAVMIYNRACCRPRKFAPISCEFSCQFIINRNSWPRRSAALGLSRLLRGNGLLIHSL